MQSRTTTALLTLCCVLLASLHARNITFFIDYGDPDSQATANNVFFHEQYTQAEEHLVRTYRTTRPDNLCYELITEHQTNLTRAPFTGLLACALAEQSGPLFIAGKHLLDNILLLAGMYQRHGGTMRDSSTAALYTHLSKHLQQHWQVYEHADAYLLIPKHSLQEMLGWFDMNKAGMRPSTLDTGTYHRATQPSRNIFAASVITLIDHLMQPSAPTDPWVCCLFGHGTYTQRLGGLPLESVATLFWNLQAKGSVLCHTTSCYFGQTKLALLQTELARQAAGRTLTMAISSGATTDAAILITTPNFDPRRKTIAQQRCQTKPFFEHIARWTGNKTVPSPHLYAAGSAIAVRLDTALHAPNIPHIFMPGITSSFVPIMQSPDIMILNQATNQAITAHNTEALLVYLQHVAQPITLTSSPYTPSCAVVPVGSGNTSTYFDSLCLKNHSLVAFVTGLSDRMWYQHQPQLHINTLRCSGITDQGGSTGLELRKVIIEHVDEKRVLVSFEQPNNPWKTWLFDSHDAHKTMPVLPRIQEPLTPSVRTMLRNAGFTQVAHYTPGNNGIGLQNVSLL